MRYLLGRCDLSARMRCLPDEMRTRVGVACGVGCGRPPTNNSWQAGERIGVQGRAGEGHGPRDVRAWCDKEVVMAKQAANVPRGGLGKAVQGGAGVARYLRFGTARAPAHARQAPHTSSAAHRHA